MSLLPQKNETFQKIHWLWAFHLWFWQGTVSFLIGIIVDHLPIPSQHTSWIIVVAAFGASQQMGMVFERRSPGALTPALRKQFALKVMALLLLPSVLYLYLYVTYSGELTVSFKEIPLFAAILLMCFSAYYFLTYFGLGQGVKIQTKGRKPPA